MMSQLSLTPNTEHTVTHARCHTAHRACDPPITSCVTGCINTELLVVHVAHIRCTYLLLTVLTSPASQASVQLWEAVISRSLTQSRELHMLCFIILPGYSTTQLICRQPHLCWLVRSQHSIAPLHFIHHTGCLGVFLRILWGTLWVGRVSMPQVGLPS